MKEIRRTQGDRSAHTRGLLVAAAIESLVEQGWAATTAVDVCNRAGVTRGALMHHFPNLQGLLAAALDTVYRELLETIPGEPQTMVALVDVTWTCTSNPLFKAVIEAWLAVANDPALRAELGPVVARFSKLVNPDESMPFLATDPDAKAFYLTAREAMLGLALGRAMSTGGALPHEAAVVDRLRADAAALDATPARKKAARR
jgi:AcrR family transcriptional regulator